MFSRGNKSTPSGPEPSGTPVPFTPQGDKRPFFFLHIPKTSGSSWNAVLGQVYGDGNFVEHAEYQMPKLLDGTATGQVCDGVSGHIPFNNWRRYPQTQAYGVLSVLRDPWARLVSHINWIDRFNHGKSLDAHGRQAEKLAHVAGLIDKTDFENRASIEAFRDGLHGPGFYPAFDNLQVRMLYCGPDHQMKMDVTREATDAAFDALSSFDGFGFCEDTAAFQGFVLASLNAPPSQRPPHENKGPLSRAHAGQDIARDVLEPLFAQDAVLYRRARALYAHRIAVHGTSVKSRVSGPSYSK